ncbi:MAG: DUF4856 domain-containing protein [Saprospiraceae bacterium]
MKKLNLLFILFTITLFTQSCKDDEMNNDYDVPTTYNFENVSYQGQLDRLGMLGELKSKISSVTDGVSTLNAAELSAMYANDPSANWSGTYGSTKQLRSKTDTNAQATFDALLNQAAADASAALGMASEGQAGIISSLDGEKNYFVNATGVEYAQIIEKGLMGACLMHQATEIYLGPGKMDGDNTDVIDGEGTEMEHHWDESFGYLGVPTDFPTNTSGLVFWGKYCNGRDGVINTNATLMNAYIKGRAAISNDDLTTRDAQIEIIRNTYDEVSAGTAIHYLNSASSNFNDDARRVHALSEAVAFIYSLNFNPNAKASSSQINTALTTVGGSVSFSSMDFYNVTIADIEAARDQLATVYGWSDIKTSF